MSQHIPGSGRRRTRRVPSSDELDRLRGVGATSPVFLPATKHPSRLPFVLVILGLFVVFALAVTYETTTDAGTGWGWTVGAAAVTVVLTWYLISPFRQGVELDRGRIGIRHPLRPGTVWVDLDRVDLAIPGIHVGFALGGARRGRKRFRGPSGHYLSVNLWSRSQGFTGPVRWGARFHLIPRQRRFVDDAEARLGRLRAMRIDEPWFEPNAAAAIMIHLQSQLPPRQAHQLREIDEYGRLLRRWAEICFDEGGRHRRDWRRDPRTLDASDLRYGPGFTSEPGDFEPVEQPLPPRPWWRRRRTDHQQTGPFV